MALSSKKRLIVLLAVLAVGAAAAVWMWLPPAVNVPEVDLSDAYPRVTAGISAARQHVQENPRSDDAWGQLGMILHAHQYETAAAECYAQAHQLNPSEFRWLYYLAVLQEAPAPGQAIANFRKSVELAPEVAMLRIRFAELLDTQGELDKAKSQLQAALKLKPGDARAQLRLAQINYKQKNYAKASEWAGKSQLGSPGHADTYRLLAQLSRRDNHNEKAAAQLELARLAPVQGNVWPDAFLQQVQLKRLDPQWFAVKGSQLIEAGNFEEGVAVLEQLVKEHPKNLNFQMQLALAYTAARKLDQAEETLDTAIKQQPKSFDLLQLRASVAMLKQQWQKALEWCHAAIKIDPKSAAAHYNLAVCLLKLNDASKARGALEEAIKLEPSLMQARLQLVQLLSQQGKSDAARRVIAATEELAPGDPVIKKMQATVNQSSANSPENSKPPAAP